MDFLKIAQKEGDSIFFNKGRDRKKAWDGVIKKIYKTFSFSLKETQTLKAY